MSPGDILSLARRNLSKSRSGPVLSSLAVAVGVGAVILLFAVGNSARDSISEKLGGFGMDGIVIFAGDGAELFPGDGQDITDNVSGIESAMPFDFWFSYYRLPVGSQCPTLIIGADSTLGEYIDIELLWGRSITPADAMGGERICIVDSSLALDRFGRLDLSGEKLYLTFDGKEAGYSVVGVCTSAMSSAAGMLGLDIPPFIYVPIDSAPVAGESVGQLILKPGDGTDASVAAEEVRNYLGAVKPNSRAFEVEDMTAYREEFTSVISLVTLFLAATAAISLCVAAIGVAATMLSSVSERRREIGIYKAIGASPGDICAMFLLEALMITLAGCLCGTLTGVCVTATLFYIFLGQLPDISPVSVILPWAAALVSGTVSGLVPAIKASLMSPADAIRKD